MKVIVRNSSSLPIRGTHHNLPPLLPPLGETRRDDSTNAISPVAFLPSLTPQSVFIDAEQPRVLMAIDRPGWAFHNIALKLQHYLSGEFDFQIKPYPEVTAADASDILVAFWWSSLPEVQGKAEQGCSVLCVYDSYAWRVETMSASARMQKALDRADILAVGNQEIAGMLRERCNLPTYVCEDGVDTTLFWPRPLPGEFVVGWTGNSMGAKAAAGVDDLKGIGMIQEACDRVGATLNIRDYQEGVLPHNEMPDWYQQISVYVCASSCEGTPNPLLEAMSCGRPVITTDVGLVRRIVADGLNGWVVNRSVEGIAEGIAKARQANLEQMGKLARISAEAHDWNIKIKSWRACLLAAAEIARCRRVTAMQEALPEAPLIVEEAVDPEPPKAEPEKPKRKRRGKS